MSGGHGSILQINDMTPEKGASRKVVIPVMCIILLLECILVKSNLYHQFFVIKSVHKTVHRNKCNEGDNLPI